MSKNVIKSSDKKKYEPYKFQVFSEVKRGVSDFTFESFSPSSDSIKNNLSSNAPKSERNSGEKPDSERTEKETITLEEHKSILAQEMEKIKKQFYDQGYVEGKKAGEAESKKEYEVSKKDYWDTLNKNLKDAKKEIDEIKQFVDSIDKEIPDLILNFVENIVGEERKLNDQLVVSVIRNSLGKLKRLQDVIFYVNPEDAETVREHFQDFDIKSDDDVTKGSFKVKSKIGEIDFSIESALNDLQKEINEQFRSD